MLHTLHWPEEIRDHPGDLSSPAPTTARELDLAELLMTEMTGVEGFFAFRLSHEATEGDHRLLRTG